MLVRYDSTYIACWPTCFFPLFMTAAAAADGGGGASAEDAMRSVKLQ
jgi:hypothetical protein